MMKIEKINDNQIRCTLTRADLASRELKLSELICGSEKAKSLFQDMIKQASSEFGFEAENMPLMIEAIPSSSDSIVLIITKVDDPEELDSKFSRFGSSLGEIDSKYDNKNDKTHSVSSRKNIFDKLDGADYLFDLLEKIKNSLTELDDDDLSLEDQDTKHPSSKSASKKESDTKTQKNLSSKVRVFSFAGLDNVIRACRLLKPMYNGANTLYKDTDAIADKTVAEHTNAYILVITQSSHTPDEFFKICNMLSEYASAESASPATLAFLEEHCEIIVSSQAIQQLGNL